MMDIVYQGEDYSTHFRSQLGSSFTATASAKLRKTIGRSQDEMEASTAATLSVASYAGDAEYGDGFTFSLSAAQTAALAPGLYRVNAKFDYTAPTALVDKTEHWLIEVRESAT